MKMRAIAVVFLAALANCSPAMAQQCDPVPLVKGQLLALGVTEDQIEIVEDVAFVNAYTRALGVGIPDGSEPKGILLVRGNGVFRFGLIEAAGCIRFHMTVPNAHHSLAYGIAKVGV